MHAYDRGGFPIYTLKKKDGGIKDTTLADVKRLKLLPSVTEILKLYPSDYLQRWKFDNFTDLVLAGHHPNEAKFLMDESLAESAKAGTDGHKQMEDWSKSLFDDMDFNKPLFGTRIKETINQLCGFGWEFVSAEQCFAGNGYGGSIDLIVKNAKAYYIFDFKFKMMNGKVKPFISPTYPLQLSAYLVAMQEKIDPDGSYEWYAANIIVSLDDDGLWTEIVADPYTTFQEFDALLDFWCRYNKYNSKAGDGLLPF